MFTNWNWKRIILSVRVAGVLVLLVTFGVGVYQLYEHYGGRIGATPERAVQEYFQALGRAEYDEVYRLTDKERLTDIFGRPVTRAEFVSQLRALTGGLGLAFDRIEVESLAERGDVRYYEVTLHARTGGLTGVSRLLVAVRRVDGAWVVSYPFAIVL